jgi:hypothetical protein
MEAASGALVASALEALVSYDGACQPMRIRRDDDANGIVFAMGAATRWSRLEQVE